LALATKTRSPVQGHGLVRERGTVQGRGARPRCHLGLPGPHGPGLTWSTSTCLVTGGAGPGLPPIHRARPGSSGVSFRGGAGGLPSDQPLSELRPSPYSLHHGCWLSGDIL